MDTETLRKTLALLREQGPTPAASLQRALGVSQPSLSRLIRAAGGRLARIGRGRATRYASRREIPALGNTWPIYRIDATGLPHLAAQLHALAPRMWWYEVVGSAPAWLHAEFADGLFPDLPWFIDDMRPQGFMGRSFARRYGEVLGLNADPRDWSADSTLTVLLRFGDDMPGDFVIGDRALEQFQRATVDRFDCPSARDRLGRYADLAEAALAGELPASSAGGEQPKFVVCVEDDTDVYRHLLVKFSPLQDTQAGRRWADLLVCEHLASEAMRSHGLDACSTAISEAGGRSFLEVTRFDRIGRRGRRGFVSLMALSNAYHGALDTWIASADRLQRDGWLTAEGADTLRVLWWFGGLIGNTDMHFGNVSFEIDSTRPLRLAPVYDMLPMNYRPTATGEVLTREFVSPLPPPQQRRLWSRAADMAITFWTAAAADTRISTGFRSEASRILRVTRTLREQFS